MHLCTSIAVPVVVLFAVFYAKLKYCNLIVCNDNIRLMPLKHKWSSSSDCSPIINVVLSCTCASICFSLMDCLLFFCHLSIFPHLPITSVWTHSFVSLCIVHVRPAEGAVRLGLPGHQGLYGRRVESDGQPFGLYLPLLRPAPQAQKAQQRQEGQ